MTLKSPEEIVVYIRRTFSNSQTSASQDRIIITMSISKELEIQGGERGAALGRHRGPWCHVLLFFSCQETWWSHPEKHLSQFTKALQRRGTRRRRVSDLTSSYDFSRPIDNVYCWSHQYMWCRLFSVIRRLPSTCRQQGAPDCPKHRSTLAQLSASIPS